MSGILSPIAPAQLPPFLPIQQKAVTSGFALLASPASVITWTVPPDGQFHRFYVFASEWVSATMTGGEIDIQFTTPDNNVESWVMFAGGQTGPAYNTTQNAPHFMCRAGTTVTVRQGTGLSAGAATLYCEIWGS